MRYTNSHRRLRRVSVLGVTLALVGAYPAAATARSGATCRQAEFPVQVGESRHTLRGTVSGGRADGAARAVLLVHGTTYDRTHWDFPIDPGRTPQRAPSRLQEISRWRSTG